jgi:hypothetical protein
MQKWINEPESLDGYAGFVYQITNNITGQKYIGKKNFWSTTRKKVPGQKRRRVVVKESDWRRYKSSSKDVKALIKKLGEDNFTFEIIHLCRTKTELTYMETLEQFNRDVLNSRRPDGEFEYYNENILSKFFRGRI